VATQHQRHEFVGSPHAQLYGVCQRQHSHRLVCMRRRKSLVSSRQPIHACANSVMRIARLGVATMHTRRHGMLSTACNVLQPEIACASDGKESTLQVHMLHFESRPGFFVTAGLWVPAASAPGVDPVTGKRAGVLYASGHSCQAWRRRDEPDVYTYQYTVSAASTTRVRARAHARVCMCVCGGGGGLSPCCTMRHCLTCVRF
jgi:hypothetical protein